MRKVKLSKIIIAIFVIFSFCEMNLFWLVPGLSTSNFLTGGYLRLTIVILGMVFWLLVSSKSKSYRNRFCTRYLCVVIVYISALLVYSTLKYPLQSFTETLGLGCHYLDLFWIVPLLYVQIHYEKSEFYLFEVFNKLTIVYSIILIITWLSLIHI